jgi:hypothetical protein
VAAEKQAYREAMARLGAAVNDHHRRPGRAPASPPGRAASPTARRHRWSAPMYHDLYPAMKANAVVRQHAGQRA